MQKTIDYYNTNAQAFYDRAIDVDLSEAYTAFLSYLPRRAHILDAGCGFGRDAKYFLNQGYQVTAFDASEEMVKLASKETGLSVRRHTFQDMDFEGEFDGVWAQASLLHVPYCETKGVYQKICQALKPDGIFYGSYKYGHGYMPTLEREFWNMNEKMARPYFDALFDVIKVWAEKDTRSKLAPSPHQMWLNFVVRKKST